MNLHEFYIGKAFDAYEYFGAHITKDGVLFRVYAPCAEKIELMGLYLTVLIRIVLVHRCGQIPHQLL